MGWRGRSCLPRARVHRRDELGAAPRTNDVEVCLVLFSIRAAGELLRADEVDGAIPLRDSASAGERDHAALPFGAGDGIPLLWFADRATGVGVSAASRADRQQLDIDITWPGHISLVEIDACVRVGTDQRILGSE